MEIYNLANSINVFEFEVTSFPEGISEAFKKLVKLTSDDVGTRSYFGIVKTAEEGKSGYYAAAEEKEPGEAEKFGYDKFTIEKGEYLITRVASWRTKTSSIKDVFQELFKDSRIDKKMPCVELYQNEDQMLCMIKTTGGR